VAVAGVAVLRDLLGRGAGSTHAEALDTLLVLTTTPGVEHRVRAAAAEALDAAPEDIRQAIARALPPPPVGTDALWEDAVDGRLPDEPGSLRDVLGRQAEHAPLTVLRRLIEAVRERERDAAASRRDQWRAVRGALHQAVALRGSRIALYDLRETVEFTGEPLPPSFLAAMHVVGDESCLESLAMAFTRAAVGQERWRHQLVQAFHAIARRERITARKPSMRRALAKSPELAKGGP
jgi:hypothetical protein